MKTTNLTHRHGGEIERLTHIEHSTFKRVPTWNFRGRVKWHDGTVSADTEIDPTALCGTPGDVNPIFGLLNEYLGRMGDWLEKPKRVGDHLIHWMPRKPAGRLAI